MSVPTTGWKLETDHTPEFGTEAYILGPRNELIVEEMGPEATVEHFEHMVKCVNEAPELAERIAALERAKTHDHETLDRLERVNAELLEALKEIRVGGAATRGTDPDYRSRDELSRAADRAILGSSIASATEAP